MPNTPPLWNSTEIHFRAVTMNLKWILFVDDLFSGSYLYLTTRLKGWSLGGQWVERPHSSLNPRSTQEKQLEESGKPPVILHLLHYRWVVRLPASLGYKIGLSQFISGKAHLVSRRCREKDDLRISCCISSSIMSLREPSVISRRKSPRALPA